MFSELEFKNPSIYRWRGKKPKNATITSENFISLLSYLAELRPNRENFTWLREKGPEIEVEAILEVMAILGGEMTETSKGAKASEDSFEVIDTNFRDDTKLGELLRKYEIGYRKRNPEDRVGVILREDGKIPDNLRKYIREITDFFRSPSSEVLTEFKDNAMHYLLYSFTMLLISVRKIQAQDVVIEDGVSATISPGIVANAVQQLKHIDFKWLNGGDSSRSTGNGGSAAEDTSAKKLIEKVGAEG